MLHDVDSYFDSSVCGFMDAAGEAGLSVPSECAYP
jgi:hypothetical protein